MKLSQLAINSDRESLGVWVPYRSTGIEFRIARIGHPEYEAAMAQKMKPWARKTATKDDARKIAAHLAAHYLLRDWRGVTDDSGNPIPYTPKQGLEVLSDPKHADIFEFIMATASEVELYRESAIQEAEGN